MSAWLLGVFLVLFLVISLFLIFINLKFRAPRRVETGTPENVGIPFEQTYIPTVAGKQLFGWWLPQADSVESVIILHGWGGNAELMLPLARPIHAEGLNVLLFDARNHGNSDAHGFSSLPQFAEDLHHAIEWLQYEHPDACRRIALLGHSVGAGAVLLAASRRKDIDAVIPVAAFGHPQWVMRRYLKHLPELLVSLINRYVQWVIGQRFDAIAPVNTVCAIDCPILLVHGLADELVPVSDARAIASACPRKNLSLLEIPNAGHTSVDKVRQYKDHLLEFLHQSGFRLTLR